MYDLINSRYLKQVNALKQQFIQNKPFPYLILKNFLQLDLASKLTTALIQQEFNDKNSDLFQFKQTNELKHNTNPVMRDFYTFFSSPEFIDYLADISDIKLDGTIDMAGFIYQPGDYLLPHDDRLEGRKIAYVLNLSHGFTAKDGGALELFSTTNHHPTLVTKKIPPTYNTLTIFKVTPTSFHQVHEVLSTKSRLSIGGWFHG